MLKELIKAFFFVFMAEMGDKTQILAMTFATQYKTKKVLLGVLIGAGLNHGIAVLLGVYLSRLININTVQLIAAIAFIGFGLWTLKADEDEEDEGSKKSSFGPVLTVAAAFFIGELGDKTQLTAVTLAADSRYPLFILMGTVSGMIVTSAIGIYVGSKLGKRIPEHAIKFGAAFIFISVGVLKLFGTVPKNLLTPLNIIIFAAVLVAAVYLLVKPSIENIRNKKVTPLKEAAEAIYIKRMREAIDKVCLGTNNCRNCHDEKCLIRYLKDANEAADERSGYMLPNSMRNLPEHSRENKDFDYDKVREGLIAAVQASIECSRRHEENCLADKSREALEIIYFGEKIPFKGDMQSYINNIRKKDRTLADEIAADIMNR